MSKSARHAKDNLFGMFILVSGIAVVGVVALTTSEQDTATVVENSQETTENRDETEQFGSGGPDTIAEEISETESVELPNEASDADQPTENDSAPELTAEEIVEAVDTPTLQLLQSASVIDGGEITSYIFSGNNIINVMPQAMQSTVLAETGIQSQVTTTIAGQSATESIVKSAKDGSEIRVIQLEIDGTLYDIRGDDTFLNTVEQYIAFE